LSTSQPESAFVGLLDLTEREVAVLCLIAEGRTSSEAAEVLHISHHTVAQHIAVMLRKSGARNRGELIARAFVTGLLTTRCWPPVPVTPPDSLSEAVL
jgi:DNA-binding CsgD family transcriptional regulator